MVPFFISSGYFTEHVVPREMGLKKGLNRKEGRRIFYTEPVGTHPAMTQVLLHRAESAIEGPCRLARNEARMEPSDVSLFIVGHGTTENENSAAAIHAQVEAIQNLGHFAEVQPAFMEEDPSHKTILVRAAKEKIVVVPFFISDGLHSREDIPCDIGFVKRGESWENPVRFRGKTLWYTRAVGSDPRMVDVILERVREMQNSELRTRNEALMHAAHRAIQEEAAKRKNLLLGELWIAVDSTGRFSIRHESDRARSAGELKILQTAKDADEVARLDESGRFRPLKSAATLKQGWIMAGLDGTALAETLEILYPAAVVHWHQQKTGTLRVRSYRETAERQTGIYEVTKTLSDRQVEAAEKRCCVDRRCLKKIVWTIDGHLPLPNARRLTPDAMPCPEPCSLFMSEARRVLKLKPEPTSE